MSRIPKTVFLLGIVSFFTDFSSEMIYPLLPIFISSVLGASTVALGVIEGIAESTAAILKMVSGIWTDRTSQRKPFIVAGYSLAGIARPLVALAQTWPVVLGLRFVDRVGKGIRSAPRDALIADVTPSEQRGAAYGFHRSMDHAGAVVGPLAASVAMGMFGLPMRTMFLVASVPALIGIAVLVLGVKEPVQHVDPNGKEPFNPIKDWKNLTPQFKLLLVALLVFTLGNSTDAFLLVRLSKAGLSANWVAALWSAHHVVKMISNYYGGRISDGFGKRPMIVLGWLFYAAIYFGFSQFESVPALILIFLAYGIYYGLVEPAERAMISDLVPARLRGTAFGYYHFVTGLGALPASILFGWIWQTWSAQVAFVVGAAFALIAAILLTRVSEKIR